MTLDDGPKRPSIPPVVIGPNEACHGLPNTESKLRDNYAQRLLLLLLLLPLL
jgi:hypothetical protein